MNQTLLSRSLDRVRSLHASVTGFPFGRDSIQDGRWRTTRGDGWTEGLWVGMLWLCYEASGDAQDEHDARAAYELMRHRRFDRSTHDLGFLFEPSALRGYALTNDNSLLQDALEAGEALLTRVDEASGLILAWDELDGLRLGRVAIIDTFMNLSLFYRLAEVTGDARWLERARRPLEGLISTFLRDDGSTRQMVRFSEKSWTEVQHQGHAADSCWSRGLGWAVYGLVRAHEAFGDVRYLHLAQRHLRYFHERLPPNGLPPYDLALNGSTRSSSVPRDSSATAVVIAALAELWRITRGRIYSDMACDLLERLDASDALLPAGQDRGILAHGCFHYPKRQLTDAELVFGDHYIVEALMKMSATIREEPRHL